MSSTMHPVAASAIGLAELPQADGDEAAITQANPLHGVKARLRVCIGELEMTVGELLAAKVDQVFTLDRTLHQPVDLVLENKTIARGQLVALDGHFAIRITELPVPLRA
jgi:flagellar motor switch protein FliN/FliY